MPAATPSSQRTPPALIGDDGKLVFDRETLRQTARAVLADVLSCRENRSDSGVVARIAGEAIGADNFLPNMGTEDYLSCLSRPAIEGACKGTPVLPRPRVKDTRAELVKHYADGRFVHPSALFALTAEQVTAWVDRYSAAAQTMTNSTERPKISTSAMAMSRTPRRTSMTATTKPKNAPQPTASRRNNAALFHPRTSPPPPAVSRRRFRFRIITGGHHVRTTYLRSHSTRLDHSLFGRHAEATCTVQAQTGRVGERQQWGAPYPQGRRPNRRQLSHAREHHPA
jgi:hypothetical protein